MVDIHPTAIVETGAELGKDVKIGPFCQVGPEVTLHDNVELRSSVVATGKTTVGDGTVIHSFATVGAEPQHLNALGTGTELVIGRNNVIRENATMNRGAESSTGVTRVGDNGYFMAYSHVGHDCKVGDNAIFANCATLAGHVEVADNVYIGGLSAVHQFVRIGNNAIIGGMTGVEFDVIPYGSAFGHRAVLAGLNLVGLKRRGFSRDQIHEMRRGFRALFAQEGTFKDRLNQVAKDFSESKEVMEIVDFARQKSNRGLTMPEHTQADVE